MKREAEDDVDALATDISALDLDVELPGTDPRAKEEYTRALDSYERGRTALGRAHRPAELEAVASALEEGRFAMESAKARIQGRRPPERTPPCFFDPRHGPSSREVEWNPPGGAPRPVPACEADAQRVEAGLEPIAREVAVNGARVPYWNAPPAFAPYVGGYFGGFAGILPACSWARCSAPPSASEGGIRMQAAPAATSPMPAATSVAEISAAEISAVSDPRDCNRASGSPEVDEVFGGERGSAREEAGER